MHQAWKGSLEELGSSLNYPIFSFFPSQRPWLVHYLRIVDCQVFYLFLLRSPQVDLFHLKFLIFQLQHQLIFQTIGKTAQCQLERHALDLLNQSTEYQ